MTLIIYKFDYDFYGTAYSICFSLSEETEKQIDEWNLLLDKIVFEEQLKTGSFRGKFPVNNDQKLLLGKMKEQGIIQPYYGATAPRACTYILQISQNTYKAEVTHTVMEQKISIEGTVSTIHFDPLGIPIDHIRGFMIKKQEYRTLLNWKFWNSGDEFTPRYIYTFSPTSVGLGTTVIDVNSNEKIDITDYNDW